MQLQDYQRRAFEQLDIWLGALKESRSNADALIKAIDEGELDVLWRRIAARQEHALQGWRQHRVYPDFVVCKQDGKLLIIETKGARLEGNPDTEYKKKLLRMLESAYADAHPVGRMEIKDPPAKYRLLLQQKWKEDMATLLADD